MKFFGVLLSLVCSLSLFATEGTPCFTHGQCQTRNSTSFDMSCFIVTTGRDANNELVCNLYCKQIPVGSYCQRERPSDLLGVCGQESLNIPIFDPNDPDRCQNAISSELFELISAI